MRDPADSYVYRDGKVVYLPIPKCATKNIKQRIFVDIICHRDEVAAKYMDFHKVAIVRDPYSRLVSAYTWFKYYHPEYEIGAPLDSFKIFVKHIFNHADNELDYHLFSQTHRVSSSDGIFLPDQLIKLENIKDAIGVLPIGNWPLHNAAKEPHKAKHDEETIEMTKERFEIDFNNLGYNNEYAPT